MTQAIGAPHIFTFPGSSLRSRMTAREVEAKASFNSKRSTSDNLSPAFPERQARLSKDRDARHIGFQADDRMAGDSAIGGISYRPA